MDLKLNSLFVSHMILQADMPIRVFGTGEGDVVIRFLEDEATVRADGKWLVTGDFSPDFY